MKISAAGVGETSEPHVTPSPSLDSERLKPGDTILDDYRVEGELGRGGMGTVYLVKSLSAGERFAVKRTRVQSEAARRDFLMELQTWRDLPEHAHLAACRFFRTVGEEIVIFAEYLEGGSLDHWILDGRGPLYEGEPDAVLAKILNIAIQSAWGLHALHEWGLIHQDVKPGNILLGNDGDEAKVSDFGLARLRTEGATVPDAALGTSHAKYGGMTREFCSPEQKEGRPLSRKTDVWSWGLAVLQMFTGTVWWEWGTQAEQVLRSTVRASGKGSHVPTVPPQVADILGRCFQQDPAMRWGSLLEAAEEVQRTHHQLIGPEYRRPIPAVSRVSDREFIVHDRSTSFGAQREDPQKFLIAAKKAAGFDRPEAVTHDPPFSGSRRAKAIADLAVIDEAKQLYEDLVKEGRKDLEPSLAVLYTEKARVHWHLGDVSGAVACFDRSIAICERLIRREGRRELYDRLARSYLNKGVFLRVLGDHSGALASCDQAITLLEQLVNQDERKDLEDDLARGYVNKGSALDSKGDHAAALAALNQGILTFERLVMQQGRKDLEDDLARSYRNKANALYGQGNYSEALDSYKQAISIHERLVNQDGKRELEDGLALSYLNKGVALHSQGDLQGAIDSFNQAITIRERLVGQDGKRELEDGLALAYLNKGVALNSQGNHPGALAAYGRSVDILERLVNLEGRKEHQDKLALSYQSKGTALYEEGDFSRALAAFDKSIAIRARLINREGRMGLRGDLASDQLYRAKLLLVSGEHLKASLEARPAMRTLEEEIRRTGREDLQQVLNWAKDTLRDVL